MRLPPFCKSPIIVAYKIDPLTTQWTVIDFRTIKGTYIKELTKYSTKYKKELIFVSYCIKQLKTLNTFFFFFIFSDTTFLHSCSMQLTIMTTYLLLIVYCIIWYCTRMTAYTASIYVMLFWTLSLYTLLLCDIPVCKTNNGILFFKLIVESHLIIPMKAASLNVIPRLIVLGSFIVPAW